ncbi:GAF domain-containing SpoIIE family protein phosphatase [Streptomyces subrutilus]|uniref:GAF domain-containing SpoIIE family protein phosphatase n=1 Tax=Streptomyces subrutilus TaxID=36818 RepID=UPI0034455167
MPSLPPAQQRTARLLVGLVPDGSGAGGVVLDADPEAGVLLGVEPDALRGVAFGDLAPRVHAGSAVRLLADAVSDLSSAARAATASRPVRTPPAACACACAATAVTEAGPPPATRRPLVLRGPAGPVLCLAAARAAVDPYDGRTTVTVELAAEPIPGWENWAVLHTMATLRGQSVWAYDEAHDRFRWIHHALVHSPHQFSGELPLQAVLDRLHPDDVEEVTRAFRALGRGETDLTHIGFRYPDGEGGYRSLSSMSGILHLGFDGPRQIVGSTTDNTRAVERRRSLDREHTRQSRLVRELAAAFVAAQTEEELTDAILHKAAPAFAGTGTLLAFVENDRLRVTFGDGIDPAMARSLDGMPLDAPKPLAEAIRTGRMQTIDSREAYRATWPQAHHLLDATTAQSFLMVPFAAEPGRPLGGWVITYDRPHRTTEPERTLLGVTAELAGQAWARIRLSTARLELAGALQREMLPAALPAIDGFEIAARYLPAHEGLDVGGDWYDVIAFPDGAVACIIGDVQGHNIQAAALMGQVRTAMHAYAWQDPSPDRVLRRTNELMLQMGAPGFATCLYTLLDPSGQILSARAGHVPPVQCGSAGAFVAETPGGLPLGVLHDTLYPLARGALAEGDATALFTDGLVEGPGLSLDDGTALICRAMEAARHEPVGAIADALMDGARATRHEDDRAVLVIRRPHRPSPR